MFTSNGGALAKNLRKRKMKEVVAGPIPVTNLFDFQGQPFASSGAVPINGRPSQVQHILNHAAPFKPFSFTSLLTADDDVIVDDQHVLSAEVGNQSQQIDQIISLHSENLRKALNGVLNSQYHHSTAEERASKKLKEKEFELRVKSAQNAELERKAEHYKGEAERLLLRVRFLERATTSLREGLQEANAARRYAETIQEDAESSFEDPNRVGPVRLDCKACARQIATVMMWPCRHVCVCTRCDAVVTVCPVCRLTKTTSVEVCLPLN